MRERISDVYKENSDRHLFRKKEIINAILRLKRK